METQQKRRTKLPIRIKSSKQLQCLVFSVLVFNILGISSSIFSQAEKLFQEPQIVQIDGFEKEGDWQIRFSQFRAKSWNRRESQRIENSKWIRWFSIPEKDRWQSLPWEILQSPSHQKENSILGLRANWDKRGDNWLELFPANPRLSQDTWKGDSELAQKLYLEQEPESKFILIPGKSSEIYCYVWGMGFRYKLELHLKDFKGMLHILQGPLLTHHGWKKIRFSIPEFIPQKSSTIPSMKGLRFLRFKIQALPSEKIQGFQAYLDYFHSYSDLFEPYIPGQKLKNLSE